MATEQKVIFTALPNGVGEGGHRLSVLVSPRLDTNVAPDTLAKWLDFADWPQTAAGIEWKLRFGSQPQPVNASVVGEAPRSDLWRALFPPASYVRPYEFADQIKGFHNLPIVSYPAGHVHAYLKDTYLSLATETELPAVQSLLAAYAPIRFLDAKERLGRRDDLIAGIEKKLAQQKFIAHGPADPDRDFARLWLFHTPSNKPDPAHDGLSGSPHARVPRPFATPKLDFHQALSMLGEHPQLMRAMGIVVELEFTRPPGLAPQNTVWLEPQWTSAMGAANKAVPPIKTRCEIGATSFVARPRQSGPDLAFGLLRLKDKFPDQSARYELHQIDPDGAAKKTMAFVNDVYRGQLAKHKTTDTATEQVPPGFRSAGLAVIRTNRAKSLHQKLQGLKAINDKLEANTQNVLSREDLTRGYAFDVHDVASGRWYPLCRRTGSARFTNPPAPIEVALADEEGWVSLGAAQSADGSDDWLRIGESIARWANGWSMVTPRPGKTVSPGEKAEAHVHQTGEFKLEVTYEAAPGTLPPQRFGREYYVRARAVDLAGNATPPAVANAQGFAFALGPERYGRFDPILPPFIVMRALLSEAESPEFLVIRSNYNTGPGVPGPVTPAPATPSERHVFPPAFDEFRAEVQGMFDTPSGLDPAAYQKAINRDRSLGEKDAAGNFVDPDAHPDPRNRGAPYYDSDAPAWPVENGNTARTPYLPDPLARGASFLGLPASAPGQFRLYGFAPAAGAGGWPDSAPFRLRIFETPAAVPPSFTPGEVLAVGVRKADVHRVRMSSHPSAGDLDALGLWEWLRFDAGLTAAEISALEIKVLRGEHWGFTPARTLTLIHAVRQPLVPTEFADLELGKAIGDTFVTLRDTMTTSRKSTERLDVRAHWFEVVDFVDPDTDVWEPERQLEIDALAFVKRVPTVDQEADAIEGTLRVEERHELKHTRHVPDVEYRTIATSRFKEHFVDRKQLDFSAAPTLTLDSQWTGPAAGEEVGVVPDSERITSPDRAERYLRGEPSDAAADYSMDYPAGTITRNTAKPDPMPQQVSAAYLVPPIVRESAAPAIRTVLNSARPAAPNVLYAVPNFKWRRTPLDLGGLESKRGGGSLRVYMDREPTPWWSSGAGELLGVVVLPSGRGAPALTDKLRPFVTQRGQDPIWRSNPQTLLPPLSDFSAAAETGTGLRLAEVSGAKVSVAGHEVGFDLDRRLIYCDIDISPGTSYFPFIRLALARFQPASIKTANADVSLSRVVLLDYIQLAPDRTATVTLPNSTTAHIAVSGRSYKKGEAGSGPAGVEVILERRRAEMPAGDDALAWVADPNRRVTLAHTNFADGTTTWSGNLELPGPVGREPYRLAIREHETLVSHTGQFGAKIKQPRLVYADAIEI